MGGGEKMMKIDSKYITTIKKEDYELYKKLFPQIEIIDEMNTLYFVDFGIPYNIKFEEDEFGRLVNIKIEETDKM